MKKLPTLRAYGIRRGMVAMLLAMCLLPSAVSRVQAQTVPTQNLKLWLKADTGVTLNGTTVSKWADQSGNATDATQTNASLQPVLQTNAVNGRPALQFNGTNQYLGFKLPIN
ncbi:MAG TPA: hypothetical protein VHA11_02325, partial [Bryobacteraceae bacterium]|nr:hypothetical protein [Bryobacteraceae bacterium]